jgi:hypothetical protein
MRDNSLYKGEIPSIEGRTKENNKYEIHDIDNLKCDKIHDFCFIGSINSNYEKRIWVIDFVKKHFTSNSIFVNTDINNNWELLGDFDLSDKNLGYNPKIQPINHIKSVQYRIVNENLFYFEKMKQSKYVLCPEGDAPWSFRLYETLMCKSIPIVESSHHSYRTIEESKLDYKYILSNNIEEINKMEERVYYDMVNENTNIFKKYHMLN